MLGIALLYNFLVRTAVADNCYYHVVGNVVIEMMGVDTCSCLKVSKLSC